MDWTLAIDRNRDALLRMLAVLLAMAGGAAVMPRHLRTRIWGELRPAESALRRLIVVVQMVFGIEALATTPRAAPVIAGNGQGASGVRIPAFALFDPRKRFDSRPRLPKAEPRIRFFDDVEIFTPRIVATPDDPVSAGRLNRRLQTLQRALADLPKQARRLARWQAKRGVVRASTGKYIAPIRPGTPPGHRSRGKREADFVLSNCHALALYALHDPPDTS